MIPSTSRSCKVLRKLPSDIIPLAAFQDTSLIPFSTTIHSEVICTGLGGFEKDLISVTSDRSRSCSAILASSNAGSASANASSASSCNQQIRLISMSMFRLHVKQITEYVSEDTGCTLFYQYAFKKLLFAGAHLQYCSQY